jgi:hypothetical protein
MSDDQSIGVIYVEDDNDVRIGGVQALELAARSDESVASLTLLTTMLDFREPGDLGVFVHDESVRQREQTIGKGGIYGGSELGFVFQTLRSKELIWPNVINNYLKGKSPDRFDLLFWNADVTNLPGPMYCWYIRNMYLENNLREPNGLTMCNTPVDLGRVDLPAYVLATVEDHIVMAIRLSNDRLVRRRNSLCAWSERTYCRRNQSRFEEQAKLLGVGHSMRRPRGMGWRVRTKSRVARPGPASSSVSPPPTICTRISSCRSTMTPCPTNSSRTGNSRARKAISVTASAVIPCSSPATIRTSRRASLSPN